MKRAEIHFPLQGARIELQTVPCIHGRQYLATAFVDDRCIGTEIVGPDRVTVWQTQCAHEFKLLAQGAKRDTRTETFDAANEASRQARTDRALAIAKGV